MPFSENGLPQMSRPPKASLDMTWLCASTNPRTSPSASVPLNGSPVTPIRESGAGRAAGSHQSPSAAELGVGPKAAASTRRSSDTTATRRRP
ncbi:hypothetical protein SGRIM128S_01014 [Streptomyces griseomycini]